MPPPMAAMATMPTTTPAAMPALFGPPDALAEPVAVTTTVCPPTVTTDGFADVVADGFVADEVPEAPETGALDVSPVR